MALLADFFWKKILINTSKDLGTLGCTIPTQGFSQQQISEFLSAANQALIIWDFDKQIQDSIKSIDEWKNRFRISNFADKREIFRCLKGGYPFAPQNTGSP